ncbi:MAG TPA: XdhC/CoxI family protein [Spirochaetia bacterium]|nr:XdhC/CoxI family protein [Spirochaetia bacterium]
MENLYADCAAILTAGEDVVMATVANQNGSAPRTAGAKMLVRRDGSLVGTIGGGLVEGQVLELARDVFQTSRPVLKYFSLTGRNVESMDMICGGNMEVLVELWSPRLDDSLEIGRLAALCIQQREKAWLITQLPGNREAAGSLPKCLLTSGGQEAGTTFPATLREEILRCGRDPGPVVVTVEEQKFLLETIGRSGSVYIFGAGHVSQKLAELTAMVNFRTVVLDDRAEFVTAARFPRADELIQPAGFAGCLAALEISQDSCLVIVTRGHRHDLTVLEQALQTQAGYIGMIGSRRKREEIYRALREQGVSDRELARVHSPIGIAIGAETPEEIAVSIVAELIAVRAGVNSNKPIG